MNEHLKHTSSKLIENVSSCSNYLDIEQAFDYANGFFDCLLHTHQITSVEFIDFKSELQSAHSYAHSVRRDAEYDLDLALEG